MPLTRNQPSGASLLASVQSLKTLRMASIAVLSRRTTAPWTVLEGVGGAVTVDRAGTDIEVKLSGKLPTQGFFRAVVEE